MFDNTIMENIRVGKKDATDAEVMEAAKRANVLEFAEKLPDGMQARIEATASLDAENETKVQADKVIVLDRVMRCPLIRAGYQYRFNDRSKKNIG